VAFEVVNGDDKDFHHYFQLLVDTDNLRQSWCALDEPEIGLCLSKYHGLRVCRQDPLECLISFLCSSAAPVFRIRNMIDNFCKALGEKIILPDGQTLFAFPNLESLAKTSRLDYDKLGLGYRGRFVRETASELIGRGGEKYINSLADSAYAEAKAELVSLPGVGAKIADCVCLFSLGKHDSVPIDTHMAKIAKRVVAPDLAEKSLTPALYDELANRFRAKFGTHAGWAQQYLFASELFGTGAWDSEAGKHRPGKR
jgi:N-glycosylase/DNA lyase